MASGDADSDGISIGADKISLDDASIQDAAGNALHPFSFQDVTNNLLQNRPNPFNPSTFIPIQISERGHVRMDVYNIGISD